MTSKPKRRHKVRAPSIATVKAVAVFAASLIVFFWALNNRWADAHIFSPFTGLVAVVTTWIFKAAGQTASCAGSSVMVNGTSLSIAQGCNGLEAVALYFAAVLAMPTRWNRRLIGLAIGLVGIFLINQIRVVGLFLVAMLKPEFIPYAHNYAGQTFVILMGMALWYFWAENYAGFGLGQTHAAPR